MRGIFFASMAMAKAFTRKIVMGNRAVITESTAPNAPAIYLHWNGGMASVLGFLSAAHSLGALDHKTSKQRMDGLAELLAAHFFECGVGRTVYRMPYGQADTADNGVYVIDKHGAIVGRLYHSFVEEIDKDKTNAIAGLIIGSFEEAHA